jgi:hypothetical protein
LLAGCSTAEPVSSFDLQMKGKKNVVSFDESLKKTNFICNLLSLFSSASGPVGNISS